MSDAKLIEMLLNRLLPIEGPECVSTLVEGVAFEGSVDDPKKFERVAGLMRSLGLSNPDPYDPDNARSTNLRLSHFARDWHEHRGSFRLLVADRCRTTTMDVMIDLLYPDDLAEDVVRENRLFLSYALAETGPLFHRSKGSITAKIYRVDPDADGYPAEIQVLDDVLERLWSRHNSLPIRSDAELAKSIDCTSSSAIHVPELPRELSPTW